MRLSSLPTYQYADTIVVDKTCSIFMLCWNKHLTKSEKTLICQHTGLSFSLVRRALTNLRKYH